MIHLVLLSGGSGSRLWPLSNTARSKQFLKVLRDADDKPQSMVQRVFGQISQVEAELDITIATCANQENSVCTQLEGAYTVVIEPERRDTAPAIMLACAHLAYAQGANPKDPVIVMPIDTYASQEYFNKVVELAASAQTCDGLTLLGVEPAYPSEKYGYIIPKSRDGKGPWPVGEFKEKPDEATAEHYIAQGALWNCGVFAFRLEYLLGVLAKYTLSASFEEIRAGYAQLPKISFDFEVVEKAEQAHVIPYSGTWKDLGTWNTLTEEMRDAAQGRVDMANAKNVHAINETALPMVVAGLEDAVVVATNDGILACSKEASAAIKKQVVRVGNSRPMYEKRYWGEYRVIDSNAYGNGHSALAKELIIAAGKQLSHQRHAHRSEVWTVTQGRGEVVLDGQVIPVEVGSVVNIQPAQMHAARAFEDLHIIEVQLGAPLIEEDIERFGYYWE